MIVAVIAAAVLVTAAVVAAAVTAVISVICVTAVRLYGRERRKRLNSFRERSIAGACIVITAGTGSDRTAVDRTCQIAVENLYVGSWRSIERVKGSVVVKTHNDFLSRMV